MTAPALKVGDRALHVERWLGSKRVIREARIVRETKSHWIDDQGKAWRKRDGAMVPQYVCARFLEPIAGTELKALG